MPGSLVGELIVDAPEAPLEPDPIPRRLTRAAREFLATETAGGAVLLLGGIVALVWANSPWDGGYHAIWETRLDIELGRWTLHGDLRHWVNDAAMAIFFFVVGLEIKREVVSGELRDPRRAALPVIAAVGGMVVPALLYLVVNVGAEGSQGWGVPTATDIAFALGVLSLLGRRVPSGMKLFLLTLAIADDIGGIVLIAIFYAGDLEWLALGVSFALLGAIVILQRVGVQSVPVYVVVGAAAWLAMYQSGVHAVIAGVLIGLLTPARPISPEALIREWEGELDDDPTPEERLAIARAATEGISVAERLAHQLHPLSSFVIIPVFALANAGVTLSADALDEPGATRVAIGIVLGLVVGKLVGVSLATWLAVRFGIGRLPEGANWGHVIGTAAVAGVGFTVALFVASLAYDDPTLIDAAKLGIITASVLAAVLGVVLLRRQPLSEPSSSS